MRLKFHKRGQPDETLDGEPARTKLKSVLKSIGESILMPEPPYTGIIRRRALDRLRQGQAIWSNPTDMGQPSGDSVIVSMPLKIVGIIDHDGKWVGDGPDPRTQTDEGTS